MFKQNTNTHKTCNIHQNICTSRMYNIKNNNKLIKNKTNKNKTNKNKIKIKYNIYFIEIPEIINDTLKLKICIYSLKCSGKK